MKKEIEELIKALKLHVVEKDNEAVHSDFDEIIQIRLFDYELFELFPSKAPWYQTYYSIEARCLGQMSKKWYKDKGIKNFLKITDLRCLKNE